MFCQRITDVFVYSSYLHHTASHGGGRGQEVCCDSLWTCLVRRERLRTSTAVHQRQHQRMRRGEKKIFKNFLKKNFFLQNGAGPALRDHATTASALFYSESK
jgi:hypothetical protein